MFSCNTCHVTQEPDAFYADRSNVCGHQHTCKACTKKRSHTYYQANKDIVLAKERERRKRPEQRSKNAARAKQYVMTHADETARYQAAYRQQHRQELLDYLSTYTAQHAERLRAYRATYYKARADAMSKKSTAWQKAHPEKISEYKANRRAAKQRTPSNTLTAAQWREIQAAYDFRCVYCGSKRAKLTRDHLTPLCDGGTHTADNIVPACKPCNSKKGKRGPLIPVQPLFLTIAPARKERAG